MTRIAHISDPHFGTEQAPQLAAMTQALEAAKPDMVVISGDISQRARRSQFKRARAYLEGLNLPVMTVPGNHDIPLYNLFGRLVRPYHGYVRHFGGDLVSHQRLGDIELIGLPSAKWWRHKDGEIPVEELSEALAPRKDSGRLRLAVFHHPLDCRRKQDEVNIIRNADEVLHTMIESRIDAVLGGHIHDPLMRTSAHRYPRQPGPMLFVLAGTCISWRTRIGAPNSFNLLNLEPAHGLISVIRMDWDEGERAFFEKEVRAFERIDTGWYEVGKPLHIRDHRSAAHQPVSALL